jgi:GTPase SAR1 family protein
MFCYPHHSTILGQKLVVRILKIFLSLLFRATIGADFLAKVVRWNESLTLRLQLWDIAGQDRFSLLSRSFYKDAVGAFVVSDLTRSETLDSVIAWKEKLDTKVQFDDGSSLPCFLLANKVSNLSF